MVQKTNTHNFECKLKYVMSAQKNSFRCSYIRSITFPLTPRRNFCNRRFPFTMWPNSLEFYALGYELLIENGERITNKVQVS